MEENIIPDQVKGNKTGVEDTTEAHDAAEAQHLFAAAKQRMMDVNNWNKFSGPASAQFQLCDAEGNELFREPRVDDLIRIDLPGPGPAEGEGYDWVRIEAIENKSDDNEELYAIRVRPEPSPFTTEAASSHFYTRDATSSFILKRSELKITAAEEGRNEVPNTETDTVIDKVRNAVVALGAWGGLSHVQWKSLMTGILKG